MKKRILSILLCGLFMFHMSIFVGAAQPPSINPLWDNVKEITATLTFNGNTGNVTIVVSGKTDVTNITATVDLYYKTTTGSWIEIEKNWSYNVNQQTLVILESFNATPGREYKIIINGKTTLGGYEEVFSKTTTATCPSAQ